MRKIFVLLTTLLLLNGCAESVALLGTSVGGASKGKIVQSSFNSAISFGVKQKTGKSPLEHAIAYAEEKNPEKKEHSCQSFIKKTNSEICEIVRRQLLLTKSKILNKKINIHQEDQNLSLKSSIDRSSKIRYLD